MSNISIEKISSQIEAHGITGYTHEQLPFAIELWDNSAAQSITEFVNVLVKSRPSTFTGSVWSFDPTIGKEVVLEISFDIAPNIIECNVQDDDLTIKVETSDINKIRWFLRRFLTEQQIEWLLFAAATAIPDEFSR